MPLAKTGQCGRCGECCKTRPEDGWFPGVEAVVPGYCPMFRWVNGVATCVGRDTEFYARICRDYPSSPKTLPGCAIKVEGQGHMNHIAVSINADDTVCVRICNRSFCIEVEEAADLLAKLKPVVEHLKAEGAASNRELIALRERTHSIEVIRHETKEK